MRINLSSRKKLSRSEQSRINGAKSRGPKTKEGRLRSANARRKHGLYAVNNSILYVDSPEAYEALRADTIAHWAPRDAYELGLVDEIVACNWLIARLRLCATHATNRAINRVREQIDTRISWKEAVTRAELEGSAPNGAVNILQRRIRAAVRERGAHIAQLKIAKEMPMAARTQSVLETQELPAGFIPSEPVHNLTEPTQNPVEPAQNLGDPK